MTGPHNSTYKKNKQGPDLLGQTNEATVLINGIETTAFVDTGTCVFNFKCEFVHRTF